MKLQTQPNAQALFSILLHEHLSVRIKTRLERHLLLKSRLRIDSRGIAMHSENLRIDPESMYRPIPNLMYLLICKKNDINAYISRLYCLTLIPRLQ